MKDLRGFGGRGKVPVRYRQGGKGCHSVRRRDGRDESLVEGRNFERGKRARVDGSRMCEYEYSPKTKFEWECLVDGRRDEDEYQRNRISVNEEHVGDRCQEFRDRDGLFHEDMSLEMEREQEVLHYGHDVGQTGSPRLVDWRLFIPAKNEYLGVAERIECEGQRKEEFARRRNYLHDEGKLNLYPAKGPCHMAPSPSQYRFSRPPSYGDLYEAGENTRSEKVDLGGFSPEDVGRDFQSDYIPLAKESQYQPHFRTPSPLCANKSQDYKDQSLVTESMEGNSKSRKYFVGEDGVGVSSGSFPRRVISLPYISHSNAKAPSAGYRSEEGEYALILESPATESTANMKAFHRGDEATNHTEYIHSYMLPSPQSKYKTQTFTPQDCASPDIEKACIAKQAVAERTERERYINEKNGPGYHTVGLHHAMPSPSKFESQTTSSMPVSPASNPVADSVIRFLPKPQQCLRSRTPLPSYSSLPDTELSHESSMRLKELHLNSSDQATCAFQDVRRVYNLSTNKLNGRISNASEDYGPEDRLWVHVMNGGDPCGHSHEDKLKSSMPLPHHRNSHEQGFPSHRHAGAVPSRYNQDFEVVHHCTVPHDVRTKAHYHEEWKSEAYKVQQVKFNQLDNDPDAYFIDEDSYIGKRQENALNPGCFHSSSCCDSSLHGNTSGLLKGRYEQDNITTFSKPFIKHQEPIWKRLGEINDRELGHLSSANMQWQMLMRRSAHLQNKDFTGVGDEAFDNTTDIDCQLPIKKLPLRMRLGKPNNYNICDIKKRLRPCAHINVSQLSKKHKSSSPPTALHNIQESYQCHSSDPSASKITPEIAELDEHSDKFKERVNHAFLESVKHLFQSSAQQRKFLGLDKYESLRCDICGSLRDFKDTRSLAEHAYSCVKMDLRARHLGLYKALCVLMGWNNFVAPENPTNIVQLSESEHSDMKDDLIIWPPVVIVHNSSVWNTDLWKQKIITVSKLESILEGDGFGGNNRKVHIGNDQGIMVVKFNATHSGLQAAQELHSFYANNKHGRDELQHLTVNGECGGDKESQEAPEAEDILYGYLGIVEDLPKLDSQIKKWSFIKSKKEVLATAP